MTDCDLCGRGIPTVIPARVPSPRLKFAYPEGVWKGLCKRCLDSAEKTYQSIDATELLCRRDKCTLCGRTGRVYPVEVQIPDFLEGIVKTERNVCDFCLEAIGKVYCRCEREEGEEGESIQGHKNVHEYTDE